MCVCNLLYIQEWGGGVGSPVQRSSPTPSQETYPLCLLLGPRVGSWKGFTLHFHFHLISCCAIPSVWLSGAGPIPQRIHLILFCRYAIPSVWRTFGINIFIRFSCMFEPASAWVSQANAATCYLVLSRVHSISTCLVRVCVCVCACMCGCVVSVCVCARAGVSVCVCVSGGGGGGGCSCSHNSDLSPAAN